MASKEPFPAREKSFDVGAYLEQQKETVDTHLDGFLPPSGEYPQVIHEAMRYSLFAGGKRIRPILALAAGQALGGEFQRLIHLACALEMIHTYSLIHDDLPAMDDDDYRRGMPTSHKKFGEGIAILAGDALLTLAFRLLAEIPGGAPVAESKVAVILCICEAIGTRRGMIAGQVVDLTTQGKPFSREQLEYIHSAKTGALIEASIYCAALLSEASEEARNHLSAFGSRIGLAFQIVDDILDIEETAEQLGKTPGKDDLGGKATYPTLYGVERSREMVVELVKQAVREIRFLGPAGAVLEELAQFISVRRF